MIRARPEPRRIEHLIGAPIVAKSSAGYENDSALPQWVQVLSAWQIAKTSEFRGRLNET
jgi:hypothetical protein